MTSNGLLEVSTNQRRTSTSRRRRHHDLRSSKPDPDPETDPRTVHLSRLLKRSSTSELEMIETAVNHDNDGSARDSMLSVCSSLDTVEDLDDSQVLGLLEPPSDSDTTSKQVEPLKDIAVDSYMARREMTPLQERVNAITVMPGAFYCFLFLLSGAWLDQSLVDQTREEMLKAGDMAMIDESRCLSSSWPPQLYAMPPLPVIAGALGIILHAPFSFMYHWSFAHRLPPGLARTTHWSRRMDQAMIHICSASMAYATSGRWDFFIANLLFNLDCVYRQFKRIVRPGRNQIRILISVVAYTIPILRRGDVELFSELWVLFALSFSLFAFYPIGGWSHSVFHLIMAFVPPLLMNAAKQLPASQDQLKIAAQCAVMAKHSLVS